MSEQNKEIVQPGLGPMIESRPWGYSVSERGHRGAGMLASWGGRFVGVLLLMAAAGLWLAPSAAQGVELFPFKLGVSSIFAVFGAWLVWAGRRGMDHSFEFDTKSAELRHGARDFRGRFHAHGALAFAEIASVHMVGARDETEVPRLFLRLAGRNEGLQIAQGDEAVLEVLCARIAADLMRRKTPHRESRSLAERLAPAQAAVA